MHHDLTRNGTINYYNIEINGKVHTHVPSRFIEEVQGKQHEHAEKD